MFNAHPLPRTVSPDRSEKYGARHAAKGSWSLEPIEMHVGRAPPQKTCTTKAVKVSVMAIGRRVIESVSPRIGWWLGGRRGKRERVVEADEESIAAKPVIEFSHHLKDFWIEVDGFDRGRAQAEANTFHGNGLGFTLCNGDGASRKREDYSCVS